MQLLEDAVGENVLKGKGKVSFSGCVKVYESKRKRTYAETVRGNEYHRYNS